jgi:hypothetical protein
MKLQWLLVSHHHDGYSFVPMKPNADFQFYESAVCHSLAPRQWEADGEELLTKVITACHGAEKPPNTE